MNECLGLRRKVVEAILRKGNGTMLGEEMLSLGYRDISLCGC